MRRSIVVLVLLSLAACERAPAGLEDGGGEAPGFGVAAGNAGRYIVVFRATVTDPGHLAAQLVAQEGGTVHFVYRHALRGFAATLPAAAVAGLSRNPNVAYIEADRPVQGEAVQQNPVWGLDRIDQRALPLSGTYSYEAAGAGVNVYVIDSGIRITHQEFEGRAFHAATFVNDAAGYDDCNGHGTHVAATVGGRTYGVAKQARLHSVRVLNCTNGGLVSAVTAGVDWVTGNHVKPAVANMSLSAAAGTASAAALEDAIRASIAAGVTYVAAAGNQRADACSRSPALLPEIMTVSATTSSDARWVDANFGDCVDLFAPGELTWSANYTSDTSTALRTGTSMATAHVSGVVALFLEAQPGATPAAARQAVEGTLTTGIVTAAQSARNHLVYSPGWPPALPPNQPPSAFIDAPAAGQAFVAGAAVTFSGRGEDPEDGSLGGGALVWTSSIQGVIGTGATFARSDLVTGSHAIVLTATDSRGAQATATVGITVTAPNAPPVAAFTYNCSNSDTCRFTDASTDDVAVTAWSWTFGSLGTSTQRHPSFTFASPGSHRVRLVVTDAAGATGAAERTVTCAVQKNGRLRCN